MMNTIENISNLALAIFDKESEVLREVTGEDLVFPVFAKHAMQKKFYLIGDLLYLNTIRVKTKVLSSKYITKVVVGKEDLRLSDYVEYSDTSETKYEYAEHKTSNAIPVMVYVEALELCDEDVIVEIEIGVHDEY